MCRNMFVWYIVIALFTVVLLFRIIEKVRKQCNEGNSKEKISDISKATNGEDYGYDDFDDEL